MTLYVDISVILYYNKVSILMLQLKSAIERNNLEVKMECKNCSYRMFRRSGHRRGLVEYYCTHPGIQPEWNGFRFICKGSRANDDMTIETSPRWCPLIGYDKIEKGMQNSYYLHFIVGILIL